MSLPSTPREWLVRYARRLVPIVVAYVACILAAIGFALMPAFLPNWLYTLVAVLVLCLVGGVVAYTIQFVWRREGRDERDG